MKTTSASSYTIEDPELGLVRVRSNARARRLTFRNKGGEIHVTTPPGTPEAEVRKSISELRPRLRTVLRAAPDRLIDLNFKIDTPFFKLTLVEGQRERFLARSELGSLQVVCPPDADFHDPELQRWLRKVVEEALRRNAKIILPPRLYMLAQRHGLAYKKVKINGSRSRWGSCSTQGNINLSYFLVLLPQHLIDYVLLHELTHTREMNHSDRFWALLDGFLGSSSDALRQELRDYRTSF